MPCGRLRPSPRRRCRTALSGLLVHQGSRCWRRHSGRHHERLGAAESVPELLQRRDRPVGIESHGRLPPSSVRFRPSHSTIPPRCLLRSSNVSGTNARRGSGSVGSAIMAAAWAGSRRVRGVFFRSLSAGAALHPRPGSEIGLRRTARCRRVSEGGCGRAQSGRVMVPAPIGRSRPARLPA